MKASGIVGVLVMATSVAALAIGLPPVNAASLPPQDGAALAVPPNHEVGFILTQFEPSFYPGLAENCPDGFANTAKDNFLVTLTPAEKARLLKPENDVELTNRWKAYTLGPNNTNICSHFDQFPDRPLYKTVRNKIGIGLDLDPTASEQRKSCSHEEFTGPDGEPGIDNQLYRVMGCTHYWRDMDGSAGYSPKTYKDHMTAGEVRIVVRLRGIDSFENDDNVEVLVANSDAPPIFDSQMHPVLGATFKVTSDNRLRAVLRGHIKNGVLTTEPGTLRFPNPQAHGGPRSLRHELELTGARLKIAFKPDGSFKGLLGGYLPVLFSLEKSALPGAGMAQVVNHDCASEYNTLVKYADGDRDPKTGRCRRISSSWDIAGVHAFVTE